MLVSYVLRLVAEELAVGHLVGEVEHVETGEQQAIRGTDELVGFCVAHHTADGPPLVAG